MVNPSALLSKVTNGFYSLRGSPLELWKAYTLKFLESFAYFSFSMVFTLFLSEDFGYSDIASGTIYGSWGALVTVYGLLSGFLVDNMGVAISIRVGFLLSLFARVAIFWTSSRPILLFQVLFVLPMGNCLGIPVLTTGIRRYTKETNRGFAFGLFYVIMNVAALLSGPLVDICTLLNDNNDADRTNYNKEGGSNASNQNFEWRWSGYRMVIFVGIIANIIACFISLTVKEIKVDNNHNNSDHDIEETTTTTKKFNPLKGSIVEIFWETIRSKNFWRFLAVCLITLNVRMIFRHLDATLPKYMVREFGPDVPKGTIYSINPALIIILVPIVTAASTDIEPLVMIHFGSYISAASVFFLAFSTSITSCVLFVVFLSIGEAIWSPRLYDYTMSITKEGREGTYMAMSSAPLFLAKLPVGFISGYLLQTYCPEDGLKRSKIMWFIIGISTIISPILMALCWKYISKIDKEDEENEAELKNLVRNNDT